MKWKKLSDNLKNKTFSIIILLNRKTKPAHIEIPRAFPDYITLSISVLGVFGTLDTKRIAYLHMNTDVRTVIKFCFEQELILIISIALLSAGE